MALRPLQIYRRRLPHWRRDKAIYFVTWRMPTDQSPLSAQERDSVAAALQRFSGERYDLLAYVIMNDHAHALLQPYSDFPLDGIMHTWKSYTANVLQRAGRRGAVWQREYFDRIVRNEKELDEKVQYILANPYRRWPGIESYPWVWCRADLTE